MEVDVFFLIPRHSGHTGNNKGHMTLATTNCEFCQSISHSLIIAYFKKWPIYLQMNLTYSTGMKCSHGCDGRRAATLAELWGCGVCSAARRFAHHSDKGRGAEPDSRRWSHEIFPAVAMQGISFCGHFFRCHHIKIECGGGLEDVLFLHILGMSSPQLTETYFSEGRLNQLTSECCGYHVPQWILCCWNWSRRTVPFRWGEHFDRLLRSDLWITKKRGLWF